VIARITPLLITFNEAANIGRVLAQLAWARRIVVVDSGSTDGTLEIISYYPRVEVFHRSFDSFAQQCNYGLTLVRTEWVFSLDADYELSAELVKELLNLQDVKAVAGYRGAFVYRIHGRSLRGTLYPPRTVLYRVKGAHYVDEGHGHRVVLSGEVRHLRSVIYHDDRKPLSRWFASQQQYARLEAQHLLNAERKLLSLADRLRRAGWPAPIVVFFYVLVVKRCFLDGWVGWFYTLQRVLAEVILALELIDRRLAYARKAMPSTTSLAETDADPGSERLSRR
jgi:glycosyltransferase involved in cell wall biosynthesis